MKKHIIIALVVIAVLALAVVGIFMLNNKTTANQEKGKAKLRMVTNAEFPPYEYHEGGEIVGIDVEIAKEIANKLGMDLEVEDGAFDAIIPSISSGKADIGLAGISITEDRKTSVDFTDTYAKSTQVVLLPENSPIKNAGADLEGKKIGVQQGTTGDIFAGDIKDATVERYYKGLEAVEAMVQGKIDAVIIDSEPAKVFDEQIDGVETLEEKFAEEEYAIAIKKGNTELVEKINKALKELKEEGKLDQIISKYIK